MPLLHAEDLALQEQSVRMYKELYEEAAEHMPAAKMMFSRFVKISDVHYNSVVAFGRFPERNPYLKRKTTLEEEVYLQNTLVMIDEY